MKTAKIASCWGWFSADFKVGKVVSESIRNLALALILCCCAFGQSAPKSASQEWRFYGHDPGGMRFSPLKQINRSNVSRLRRVWTYRIGELQRSPNVSPDREAPAFECTPLVIDGVLYLSTPSGRVIALDAETGKEIWQYDPFAGKGGGRKFHQHRGVSYWEGPSGRGQLDRRILFGTYDGRLIALDARTGRPCPDFGKDGAVDLRAGFADNWPSALYAVTSPPAIYKDLVITGARLPESPSEGPSGDVRAFDVRTGRLIWTFHTVPRPGELGHETWEGDSWKDRTGTNVWSIISVDVERGIIFLPIGSPAYDFYGGDRKGKNLFGNSLVALKAESGKLIWYYQMVHHDIWDYDLPAQPVLATLRRNGKQIPAVVQVTKMGFVFVLDRLTGNPLFPVQERPVPQSKVEGEKAWPTQPFPLRPPALCRQLITGDDISKVTPESYQYCMKLFKQLVGGKIFHPIQCEDTLVIPGTLGGCNWSGASFDPESGYLYVNANELPLVAAINCQTDISQASGRPFRRLRKYVRFWDENLWPCVQPPWGTLNAIDLNKGEIVWRVPLGEFDELKAKGIPKTGAPSLGGSIVTAAGLVFIAGTNDSRFRAFDARTGQELWTSRLEASGHATPITYLGKRSGKQYVVIAAGGGGYLSANVSDALVAFALPE